MNQSCSEHDEFLLTIEETEGESIKEIVDRDKLLVSKLETDFSGQKPPELSDLVSYVNSVRRLVIAADKLDACESLLQRVSLAWVLGAFGFFSKNVSLGSKLYWKSWNYYYEWHPWAETTDWVWPYYCLSANWRLG